MTLSIANCRHFTRNTSQQQLLSSTRTTFAANNVSNFYFYPRRTCRLLTTSNSNHPYKQFRKGISKTIKTSKQQQQQQQQQQQNLSQKLSRVMQNSAMQNVQNNRQKKNYDKSTVNYTKEESPLSRVLQPYKKVDAKQKESMNMKNDIDNNDNKPIRIDEKSITQIMNLLSKCTTIVEKLTQKQRMYIPPTPSWLDSNGTSYITFDHYNKEEQIQRIQQYKDVDKIIQIITQESTKREIHQLVQSSPRDHVKTFDSLNMILTQCFILCSNSLPPRYWNIVFEDNDHAEEMNQEDVINNEEIIIDTTSLQTPLQNAMKLYHSLVAYNLDIQPIHYESIIKTALYDAAGSSSSNLLKYSSVEEGGKCGTNVGYEIASKLFKKQINVDDSAYVPIDSKLGWDSTVEMGLYSVAMNAVKNKRKDVNGDDCDNVVSSIVGEEVMDAVDKMCMISSTDQERCKCCWC